MKLQMIAIKGEQTLNSFVRISTIPGMYKSNQDKSKLTLWDLTQNIDGLKRIQQIERKTLAKRNNND